MDFTKSSKPQFVFSDRAIHVWSVTTKRTSQLITTLNKVLSTEEHARAARLRFEHLQTSFIFSRGTLRVLLGHYLKTEPKDITFLYNRAGKPQLNLLSPLRFNLSHSGDFVIFAFSTACELGIDIEQIRPISDIHALAGEIFCADETSRFAALSHRERERAFFRCWTRKEAYVKAIGDGLSRSLRDFHVPLESFDSPRQIYVKTETQEDERWTLHDVDVSPQYATALTYRDTLRPLRFISLDDLADLQRVL